MRAMIEGFLTGNFRQWGATQYAQYQRALGQSEYCGIELEFVSVPSTEEQVKLIERKIRFVNSREIIHLFSVSNPKEFRKELIEVWTFLLNTVPVSGSIHFNHQVLLNWSTLNNKRNSSYFIREDIYNVRHEVAYRMENKYGVGTLNWEDMFLQMLQSYGNRFNGTTKVLPEFDYPKNRQLTRFIPRTC
jgi:hypothetical protein